MNSDEADIRMGTFVQAAAFIDALALAYSSEMKVTGKLAGQWSRFVEAYFPADYALIADEYDGLRNKLLHNFSAAPRLAFTHDDEASHLTDSDGRLILDRGSFVAATTTAYASFKTEALTDEALGRRVLNWFDGHPPIAFLTPRSREAPTPRLRSVAASAAWPTFQPGTSLAQSSASLTLSAEWQPSPESAALAAEDGAVGQAQAPRRPAEEVNDRAWSARPR